MKKEGLIELMLFFSNKVKLKNSTALKHFGFLKTFLRYAVKKEYTDITDFHDFKPKLKKTKKKIIFFTEEELELIKDLEIPSEKLYLKRVRDVLLFLCFTGLRYSEAFNLKRSQINDNSLSIITKKTHDSLTIELNETSKAILDKYSDIPFKKDKALPVISNQRFNDYIKELAELAEINEPVVETFFVGTKRYDTTKPKYEHVTIHIGRRTFKS